MKGPETVASCGEFGLIVLLEEVLASVTTPSEGTLLGIGDDAAIWTPTAGTRALITTDSLIHGVHFRLDWTSWADLGYKAIAASLSDIAAMGGRPRIAVISLALTGDEPVDGLRDCYRALGLLAEQHGVVVAGGDVVASPERMGLHVTVVGETWPEAAGRALTRGGARPGDFIGVGAALGLAAAGVEVLRTGAGTEDALPWLAAHARPEPALRLGRILVDAGATAAMDVSDGLYGDLAKICDRSGVSARIWLDSLPVPDALRQRFPTRWLELATRGGEDYTLLFTAEPRTMESIAARARADGLPEPAVIGEIVAPRPGESTLVLRESDGLDVPIDAVAFDHFRRP